MRRLIPGILFAIVLGGCVATSGSLRGAADRLDDTAQRFYVELRYDDGASYEARDAGALALAARDFSRQVHRGTPRAELQDDFDYLAARFHHVRERYDDGHRLDATERKRFNAVADAYLELEGAFRYQAGGYHG